MNFNQFKTIPSGAARRSVSRAFLTGLAAVAPILVTIAVVIWLIGFAESLLGNVLRLLLPDGAYVRGMGLVIGLLLVLSMGYLMQAFFFRRCIAWCEQKLAQIPLLKTVYGAVRDLTGFFSKSGSRKFSKVVMLQLPNIPMRLLGFITVEDFAGLGIHTADDEVAVYLPMSYQIGGYTIFVRREYLTPLDLSLEEAMRFVVTAGLSRPGESVSQEGIIIETGEPR
jgi:uncharacterized membrane protein